MSHLGSILIVTWFFVLYNWPGVTWVTLSSASEYSPFRMDYTSTSSRFKPTLLRYPSPLIYPSSALSTSTSTSLPPISFPLLKRHSFSGTFSPQILAKPIPEVKLNETCSFADSKRKDFLSRTRITLDPGNVISSSSVPFGDLEGQIFQYLEQAHALLVQYAERSKKEIDSLRQKEQMMNEEFSKVNTVAGNTDQALALCQSNLNSLENTISEVYVREKDASKSASSLEEENQILRERLRKLSRIEIKRMEVDRPLASLNENSTSIHQLIQSGSSVQNSLMTRAAIVYNNKTVAIFNTIRYNMDDQYNLFIEDLVKKIKVPIIKGFDHLKILRINGTYRLTLANQRGNMFFEHKKFDKFYSMVPNEMKLLKSTSIVSERPINWVDHNTRCGFFACFFLKPSSIEPSPDVVSTRDKTRIGNLSPFVAYYNFMDFVVSTVTADGTLMEVKFTSPYLDKDKQGNLVIRENAIHHSGPANLAAANEARKIAVKLDHSSVDIVDRVQFAQMIQSAFP